MAAWRRLPTWGKWTAVVVVAFVAFAGIGSAIEGGEDESAPKAQASHPATAAHPATIRTYEQFGAKASEHLAGVSDMDLLPSEQGAEYLVENGYVDADKFCANLGNTLGSELAAERSFNAGWRAKAPAGLGDMGATMYNALWAMYCLPGT